MGHVERTLGYVKKSLGHVERSLGWPIEVRALKPRAAEAQQSYRENIHKIVNRKELQEKIAKNSQKKN